MPQLSLRPLPGYKPFPGPLVTVIMDGVGLGKRDESDGVFLAYKPTIDSLIKEGFFAKLKAHLSQAVARTLDELQQALARSLPLL